MLGFYVLQGFACDKSIGCREKCKEQQLSRTEKQKSRKRKKRIDENLPLGEIITIGENISLGENSIFGESISLAGNSMLAENITLGGKSSGYSFRTINFDSTSYMTSDSELGTSPLSIRRVRIELK